MEARFFYGEDVYNTWSKIFVLTKDGKLYSEYLHFMNKRVFEDEFDFEKFQEEDFCWDGYQSIEEIDEATAKSISLTRQSNWVDNYLKRLK